MQSKDQQLLKTAEEIGRLLFLERNDELSKEERQRLNEWLYEQGEATRDFIEHIMEWPQIEKDLQVLYSFNTDEALAEIQKRISNDEPVKTNRVKTHRFRMLVGATIGLILFVFVGFFYLRGKTKTSTAIEYWPMKERFQNDIAPGGNKAILQLASGERIVLDNVSNGELANQGILKVKNLKNRQLTYQPARSKLPSYNILSTPKGGQYQVILPDGSKVWLNAASSLRFPTVFSGKERLVELSGEAFFQIAKNVSMPFKVSIAPPSSSGDGGAEETYPPLQIEVLGTEFNIMAYAEEGNKRITLISGAVKVSANENKVVLEPGQQAQVGDVSTVRVLNQINTEEQLAWKNGLFQFQNASIQSILRQVARWYDVDIVYKEKVDQQFVGKIPREVPISTVLKILESTGWVHFMIEGKKITVTR